MTQSRKKDHLDLTRKARPSAGPDERFHYEPLLGDFNVQPYSYHLINKTLRSPFWISSMTGGHQDSLKINRLLAECCGELGMGMGLGSCRPYLEEKKRRKDFALRSIIGQDQALWANLGIAQVNALLMNDELGKLEDMLHELEVDGLFVHLNPLQEFFQPEGDRWMRPALEIISELRESLSFPLGVKEVGQGMGPKSLHALVQLKVAVIECAGFGGTNFSILESLRGTVKELDPLTQVGHCTDDMVGRLKSIGEYHSLPNIIVSGGIKNYLDGLYLEKKLQRPCLMGMASQALEKAKKGKKALLNFFKKQLEHYQVAQRFLEVHYD